MAKLAELVDGARSRFAILAGLIGSLWIVQVVNTLLGGALVGLGVHPRTISGLWGILFAPFIHGGFAHLIANTIPLAVMGALVMLRRKRDLVLVSLASALVGGLGIWLIAPSATVHVGASILVFGYLGYLLAAGIFERKLLPILGTLAVALLYGSALRGILPLEAGVSWQGHLFGLLGGVLAARALRSGSATSPATRATGVRVRPETPRETADARAETEASAAEEQLEIERELAAKKRRLK